MTAQPASVMAALLVLLLVLLVLLVVLLLLALLLLGLLALVLVLVLPPLLLHETCEGCSKATATSHGVVELDDGPIGVDSQLMEGRIEVEERGSDICWPGSCSTSDFDAARA
jgi:hypothetical protein